jgi:hypothetical protein
MTTTQTAELTHAARRAALGVLVLVAWGVGTGLLVGLFLVHLLGWLGLPVDSGTGSLLQQALLP